MKTNAKISIVVPAYNCENTIENTLNCLANQTYSNLEVIVIDDFSTDNTYSLVSDFIRNHHNFHLYQNKKNVGAGNSKNYGLKMCHGKFIGFCDADDIIPDDYFERLYCALQKENADLAVCNLALVYENGQIQPLSLIENSIVLKNRSVKLPKVHDGSLPYVIPVEVVTGFWADASAPTMLFKRELIQQFPFYDVVCDDIPAVIPAVASASKIVYVPDLYYNYIQRSGSLEHNLSFSDTRLYIAEAVGMALERFPTTISSTVHQCVVCNHLFVSIVNLLRQIPKDIREVAFEKLYNIVHAYPSMLKYLSPKNNPYISQLIETYPQNIQPLYHSVLSHFLVGDINGLLQVIYQGEGQITNEKPLVSIIIPVYNGSNYMREAINSALCQDYPSIEIIVVNDGSKDDGATDAIAKSYNNRIRYISKPNGGVSTALNAGIKAMRGEYFSWLSHDDLYHTNKVSKQIEAALAQHDRTRVIVSGTEAFDNDTGNILMLAKPLDMYPKEKLEKPLWGVFHGLLNGCAMLIHKSHFERIGLFDEALKTTQDYDMWFRLLRGQVPVYTNDVLVRSRCHPAQESNVNYHQRNSFDLWKKLIDQTTPDERIQMCGTEADFFKEVYQFLSVNTPFHDAAYYALKCYLCKEHDSLLASASQSSDFFSSKHYSLKNINLYRAQKKMISSTLNEIPVPILSQLAKILKLHKDKKLIISVAQSISVQTTRIFSELALNYPMVSIQLTDEPTYSIHTEHNFLCKLQVPINNTPDVLLKLLMLMRADMVIFAFDSELTKRFSLWNIHFADYLDHPFGFVLDSTFSINRYIFQHVGQSAFVITHDNDTNTAYRCIFNNLISANASSISNIIDGKEVAYNQADESDIRKALKLYASTESHAQIILQTASSIPSSTIPYHGVNEAELMRNTVSWRITAPLRKIRTTMNRLKFKLSPSNKQI